MFCFVFTSPSSVDWRLLKRRRKKTVEFKAGCCWLSLLCPSIGTPLTQALFSYGNRVIISEGSLKKIKIPRRRRKKLPGQKDYLTTQLHLLRKGKYIQRAQDLVIFLLSLWRCHKIQMNGAIEQEQDQQQHQPKDEGEFQHGLVRLGVKHVKKNQGYLLQPSWFLIEPGAHDLNIFHPKNKRNGANFKERVTFFSFFLSL